MTQKSVLGFAKAENPIFESRNDHLSQNRWRRHAAQNNAHTAFCSEPESDELLASACSEFFQALKNKKKPASKQKPSPNNGRAQPKGDRDQVKFIDEIAFSPWFGLFGDFAREKAQHQTPSFMAGSGGVVAAFDCEAYPPQPHSELVLLTLIRTFMKKIILDISTSIKVRQGYMEHLPSKSGIWTCQFGEDIITSTMSEKSISQDFMRLPALSRMAGKWLRILRSVMTI